ncbi:hypothetical protein K492DRAFT_2243 [Lichtheimia hyalospora FSU 10163]|nr:hypothetical protein K492DRAFT_2243 [Lichtheimia hyalospora FSU 10163]
MDESHTSDGPVQIGPSHLCYISLSFSPLFTMTTTPRSPSSPTSPTLASATPPPWFPMLKKSYTKNFFFPYNVQY